MAFCGQCGTKVNDGARFCPSCGTSLLAATVAAPEPQVIQAEPEAPVEQVVYAEQETAPPQTSTYQPEQQGAYQSTTFEPVAYAAPSQQSYQQQSYQQPGYQQQSYQQQGYQQQGYQQSHKAQHQERAYEPDGDKKTLSIGAITMFSYSGILFFIPLIAAKNSRFARFHASQGLNILLSGIAYSIASALLSFLFGLISWQLALVMGTVFGIGSLALFVLVILGVVNVCKGEMKPLPIIGKFQIIKM